jgi:hypothetical protein
MRLLDTTTLELREFYLADTPPYVILSHTWSDGEVIFQEMSSPIRNLKKGFDKISRTCEIARGDGLKYAWVDTCCIDKSSSAELSEAINSMYQWYSEAEFCYVYLEDLPPGGSPEVELQKCRWFTRGWTLQELIAPKNSMAVKFYDMTWEYRGSRLDFTNALSSHTGIPAQLLLRGSSWLSDFSIAERMSWAASRKTTRTEDLAYCLLGIFDVNMPLLYGEGMKAFRRLQEEIIKRNNDLTIFAWEDPQRQDKTVLQHYADIRLFQLFAQTPAAFLNSSKIRPFGDDFEDFSITNKGLLVSGEAPLREVATTALGPRILRYALFVGVARGRSERRAEGGIYLRKIGPRLFIRDLMLPLAGFYDLGFDQMRVLDDMTDYYILIDPKPNISEASFRFGALHIPSNDIFELEDAVPETLWDVTDKVFLKSKPYSWIRYPMVIALEFRGSVLGENMELVIFCQYKEGDLSPSCKVFWRGSFPREETIIFQQRRNRQESIYWSQFEIDAQHILELNNIVERRVGRKVIRIGAYFEEGIVPSIADQVEMFSLKFDITQHDISEVEVGIA